jgi:hypothetical protein
MRQAVMICVSFVMVLSGCDGWTVRPLPYLSPSPFPSPTAIISSPTPIVLVPPVSATFDSTSVTPTNTAAAPGAPTPTFTEYVPLTFEPSITQTPFISIRTNILGCNTSLDVTHGMGEVTNAFVTISNAGNIPLMNVCATLNALDEGRVHPDKTKCVAVLPAGYQVTQKLTVDTTFEKATPIQVDVTSEGNLLQRVSQNSCTDIGLIPPSINDLGIVKPVP